MKILFIHLFILHVYGAPSLCRCRSKSLSVNRREWSLPLWNWPCSRVSPSWVSCSPSVTLCRLGQESVTDVLEAPGTQQGQEGRNSPSCSTHWLRFGRCRDKKHLQLLGEVDRGRSGAGVMGDMMKFLSKHVGEETAGAAPAETLRHEKAWCVLWTESMAGEEGAQRPGHNTP